MGYYGRPIGGKIIWRGCPEIYGLKFIFYWEAHFVILVKSLFKSFVSLLTLCTVTNNEVSSAKHFWAKQETIR